MSASPPVAPSTSRLVSRYGVRPSLGTGQAHFHAGIDLGTAKGRREEEPVYAAKGGQVVAVYRNVPAGTGPGSGYGNGVVIGHPDNTFTLYAHMKDGSVVVQPGQAIAGGTRIGLMGNSSNGLFSPLPSQSLEQWQVAARARGYMSHGTPVPMQRHVHVEKRIGRYDGPYPQSAAEATSNGDPGVMLRELGLIFSTRGAATIAPGSPIDRSRAQWQPSMAGTLAIMGLDGAELDALGQETGYEPPEFERDVKWGITPTEKALLVTGGIVLAGTIAAFIIRRRMRPNRRRSGPRRNRLRTWGAK